MSCQTIGAWLPENTNESSKKITVKAVLILHVLHDWQQTKVKQLKSKQELVPLENSSPTQSSYLHLFSRLRIPPPGRLGRLLRQGKSGTAAGGCGSGAHVRPFVTLETRCDPCFKSGHMLKLLKPCFFETANQVRAETWEGSKSGDWLILEINSESKPNEKLDFCPTKFTAQVPQVWISLPPNTRRGQSALVGGALQPSSAQDPQRTSSKWPKKNTPNTTWRRPHNVAFLHSKKPKTLQTWRGETSARKQ